MESTIFPLRLIFVRLISFINNRLLKFKCMINLKSIADRIVTLHTQKAHALYLINNDMVVGD